MLCPCGAVARRLNGLGLRYRVERVPYRRRGDARPEIEELTGQRRVPVLVDGDEVVHDSKRILQYLDWAYEKPKPAEKKPRRKKPENGGSEGRRDRAKKSGPTVR